jgi:GGDEF domain-containing protein
MFISIKRFLESRSEDLPAALLRMVQLLLQGIETHAVKGDAADHQKFIEDMQKIREGLGGQPAASEVLVLAGSVVKSMEEYNNRTARFIHAQCAELQAMVGMLTKTMTSIASGSEGSITRLQTIEKHLHKASMIEDFQTAKLRMSECLDTLRGEIVLQREESAQTVAHLRSEIEKSQERMAAKPIRRTDLANGVPERSEAETALVAAARENRRLFAVIFVVERVSLVNSRFGYAAGDQVLHFFAQHLVQGFSSADKLFRWSGPSFLLLMERRESHDKVRAEVTRITSQRLTTTIQVGARSVLLPVAANWAMFPVLEIRPVQLLFQQLDSFVHGGAGSDDDVGA